MNPSDNDNQDKVIIQKVIKETSSMGGVDNKTQQFGFKIIVLHEIDNLTKDAQSALRRTMEKYMKTCRLIMSCNYLTKIIAPIRSRCLSIRIPSPKVNEVEKILIRINGQEGLNMKKETIENIANNSNRNVRYAINSLQFSNFIFLIKHIFFIMENQMKCLFLNGWIQ